MKLPDVIRNVRLLLAKPTNLVVRKTGAQSVNTGATDTVKFDSVAEGNENSEYDTSNGKYTAKFDKKIMITAHVRFDGMTTASLVSCCIYIYKNGTAEKFRYYDVGKWSVFVMDISHSMKLVTGDYIEIKVKQEDAGARSIGTQDSGKNTVLTILEF